MRIKILFIFTLLLIPSGALAAGYCGNWGISGTAPWTVSSDAEGTASAASTDVQACVSNASVAKHDTINVTATGSVSWGANAVVIPITKPVNIIGPYSNGSWSLTINMTGSNAFVVSGSSGDPYLGTTSDPSSRISGFSFVSPTNSKYTAIYARGQGWRVDHCKYESVVSTNTTSAYFIVANNFNATTSIVPAGVVDNNYIINGKVDTGIGGSFSNISGPWYTAYSPGTSQAIYIEDNRFSPSSQTNYQLNADSNWSGIYVTRYNTFTDGRNLVHSLQDGGRGPRGWEMYGNEFIAEHSAVGIAILSGTGVAFANSFIRNGYTTSGILLGNDRSYTSKPTSGKCDGTSQWDGNTSDGWPCRDQIGRGSDASLWTGSASPDTLPGPTQSSQPAYFWANFYDSTQTAPSNRGLGLEATHVQANRDYYAQGASFDGTSGVGCGALAARPATCTTGVAYWATDQSCSYISAMVGQNPTTPISGTLYKCTDTDTWTSYYTPYTYPHPLRTNDEGEPEVPGTDYYIIANSVTGSGCTWSEDNASVVPTEAKTLTLTVQSGYKLTSVDGTLSATCGGETCQGHESSYTVLTGSVTENAMTLNANCEARKYAPMVAP